MKRLSQAQTVLLQEMAESPNYRYCLDRDTTIRTSWPRPKRAYMKQQVEHTTLSALTKAGLLERRRVKYADRWYITEDGIAYVRKLASLEESR